MDKFVVVVGLIAIVAVLCHAAMQYEQKEEQSIAEEETQKIQSILDEKGDSLTAYLEGEEVDWEKIDLSYYHVSFNDDLTEMYLTRKQSAPVIINNGYSGPRFFWIPSFTQ